MSTQPVMITKRVGYFPGSVNIGVVFAGQGAILIDSGLDGQAAKKCKKGLDSMSTPLIAVVQTHAHADHFGGNHYLLSQYPAARVYAPKLEEAIMRNPLLEPIYLGMGAAPLAELQNKFLMAPASRVDEILPDDNEYIWIDDVRFQIINLPGHSWQQTGLVVDGICFAADSYFAEEVLAKHKLPFLVDVYETKRSLQRLLVSSYAGYIPGHGDYEENPRKTIQYNYEYHERLLAQVEQLLSHQRRTTEELLALLCQSLEIVIDQLGRYTLYRTALMGYLVGLVREERIRYSLRDNYLCWEKITD